MSDIDSKAAQQCADAYKAEVVTTDEIFAVACDVFAPCALGSCINATTINKIKARIVCGAANNQLASDEIGDLLHQKQIFYVPDYVVNVGGLIHVVLGSGTVAQAKVNRIYNAVVDIHQRSINNQEPSHRVANRMALQILSNSQKLVAHI